MAKAMAKAISSLTACAPGLVIVGASSMGLTVILKLSLVVTVSPVTLTAKFSVPLKLVLP